MSQMAVFCPCREPAPLGPEGVPALLERSECWFGVDTLLLCPKCVAVRCPYCADAEPVAWYCAACLMETTRQGARQAANRCMRNCLRCPRCGANALLKPAGTAADAAADAADAVPMLAVECAAPACGWRYAGAFKKPVKDAQPVTVAQQVRALAEQPLRVVLGVVSQRFPAKRELPADAESGPAVASAGAHADGGGELPLLVPLRAKVAKRCRVCTTCLADPSRQPSQAVYTTKLTARRVLPVVEAYRVGEGVKLVVRNFGDTVLDVRLASPDADTAVATPQVEVPPASSSGDGFAAPLFLVERESPASRRAFMAQASQQRGPGWAVGDVEAPAAKDELRLFTSSARPTHAERVGAWIRVRVQRLDGRA